LKVTNDAEFAEYAGNNYNLDEDSPDAAEQDDSSGYFSEKSCKMMKMKRWRMMTSSTSLIKTS
jgi:hypothetical protein